MLERFLSIDVLNNDLIRLRASAGGRGDQSAVRKVPRPPKIDRRSISVLGDEHVVGQLDRREVVIAGSRVSENLRPDSQEGDVEGPNIPEGRFYGENLFPAYKGLVWVDSPVERKKLKNSPLNPFPNLLGGRKKARWKRRGRPQRHL